ncbi:hypothetical protein [Streptomyces atratus]|uniref:hypothetical protein n=1 Tax=Streptomyces atratus TaxID=1893 RepID=UPI0037B4FC7E
MINEHDSIDWSSMSHAYGPASDVPAWLREMAAADSNVRDKTLGHFYSAAHHQGDVYACTTASLPFLFALADDPAAPDRASIVELLLSIGRESVDRDDDGIRFAPDGTISTACADSAAVMRDHADAFVSYAADPDPGVRRAACGVRRSRAWVSSSTTPSARSDNRTPAGSRPSRACSVTLQPRAEP